jgi:hypothetical protein
MGLFEPEIPKQKSGIMYENWLLYWYKKFESENKGRVKDVEYWRECSNYVGERWFEAMRKVHGVQSLDDKVQ